MSIPSSDTVRYATLRLRSSEATLHPFAGAATAPEFGAHAVHHLDVINEENAIVFLETDVAAARLREFASDTPRISSATVSEPAGKRYFFAQTTPGQWADALAPFVRPDDLLLQLPAHYTESGVLEFTAVGGEDQLRDAVAALPEEVRVDVLSTGEYAPEQQLLYDRLTPRQLETVRAAVRMGYYDVPREADSEDIGEWLGICADTVGEHLRKVESTLFTHIARSRGGSSSAVG